MSQAMAQHQILRDKILPTLWQLFYRYSLDLDAEAKAIEDAVAKAIADGYRTGDIYTEGTKKVTTDQMGDVVIQNIR